MPQLWSGFAIRMVHVGPLIKFGGWMTVSNVISPIMVYFDRFLVGARLGVATVPYYVVPYEVVNRLQFVPASISGVLFPAVSSAIGRTQNEAARLFARSSELTAITLFPAMAVGILFAREGLSLWLGAAFANQGYRVLQYLAVGIFVNSFAQLGFAVVQGGGRADLTAKFHMFEFPFYLAGLWYLLSVAGAVGAAIAWLLRASLDLLLLSHAVGDLINEDRGVVWEKLCETIAFGLSLLVLMFLPSQGYWKISVLIGLTVVYAGYAWRVMRTTIQLDSKLVWAKMWLLGQWKA